MQETKPSVLPLSPKFKWYPVLTILSFIFSSVTLIGITLFVFWSKSGNPSLCDSERMSSQIKGHDVPARDILQKQQQEQEAKQQKILVQQQEILTHQQQVDTMIQNLTSMLKEREESKNKPVEEIKAQNSPNNLIDSRVEEILKVEINQVQKNFQKQNYNLVQKQVGLQKKLEELFQNQKAMQPLLEKIQAQTSDLKKTVDIHERMINLLQRTTREIELGR